MTKPFEWTSFLISSTYNFAFLSYLEAGDGQYSPFEGRTPVHHSFLRVLHSQQRFHIHIKKFVSYFLMQAKHSRSRFKARKEVKEKKRRMEMKIVDGIQILDGKLGKVQRKSNSK